MANAVAHTKKAHYLEAIDARQPDALPDWADAVRETGAERFLHAEMPHTRLEEWRQTNIAPIVNTPYASVSTPTDHGLTASDIEGHLLGGGAWTELVFVDGFYAPDLSRTLALPEGVRVASLREAIDAGDPVVREHLGQVVADRGAYPALNAALLRDGAFVHVPRNTALEAPVHLLFLASAAAADRARHPRNLVVLGESAEATVTVTHAALGGAGGYLENVVDEVALGPNARLRWHKLVRGGADGNHLATTEVRQQRDSRLEAFAFTLSGNVTRNQLCVGLAEEGATCSLSGLYLNDGNRLIDNALDIQHAVPHCASRIAYKGVLDGSSKAVFTGKVYVAPDAQQTDSDQLSNNLLLSDTATIDAKPQLEIYADDVKCTHGATVGSPPKEIVFYFRSRGISEQDALSMLTFGFAEEIVADLEEPVLRERLTSYLETTFRGTH